MRWQQVHHLLRQRHLLLQDPFQLEALGAPQEVAGATPNRQAQTKKTKGRWNA